MRRSERLARHYLHSLDLRAVYVAAGAGEVMVGLTRYPAGKAKSLKRGGSKMLAIAWLPTSVDAGAVAPAIRFDRSSPTLIIAWAAVAAHSLDMVLTDDAQVQPPFAAVHRRYRPRYGAGLPITLEA